MSLCTTAASIRAVLFDWDGTLVDSYHADAQAYLAMFKEMGVDWREEELARHYSPDWYRVYRAAGIPESRWSDADRIWRSFYGRHEPDLMRGARRVLSALRPRFVLGIVTSGDRTRVRAQVRRLRLTKMFAVCVCSEDARRRKPHPAPIQLALRRMGLSPVECVYAGDAPEDMQMARRAGVRTVAIQGHFPTHQRLRAAQPCALLRSIEELPGLLRSARF
jgi:HAD superfamily hydrolase (TIGR01509 family)